jgi:AcrR family transcriptional regulator
VRARDPAVEAGQDSIGRLPPPGAGRRASNTLRTDAPARRRHTPEVRRALIIKAAQDIIAEQGYAAASARTVAARCGISPGTLTYHFPSIDALLGAALRDASIGYTNSAIRSARSRPRAHDRLMSLIDAALPSTPDASRNWRLWIEYWARASHSPELAELHSERYAEWRSTFAAIVAEGVESGEFRSVDPSFTALTLVALLDGLGLQAVIGDAAVSLAIAHELLDEYVSSLCPSSASGSATRA